MPQYAQAGGLIQQLPQQFGGGVDAAGASTVGLLPAMNVTGGGQVAVRLLLTQMQAGAVTGQGGTNLRQIRQVGGPPCSLLYSANTASLCESLKPFFGFVELCCSLCLCSF